ncbi:anti-sigma factor antagonist [Leptospira ryugenii]|uniref:Anti-sigma factor antagonist n=1 Tax=Leptospira ryugenii TaxID=1917863 RepID=A0A2P2DYC4_9LEPT|nr:STAS domain-containing protein [Leptospira ryugenii]GBF49596.1 anti-sigma factor antagonist [Leptospira ryugenii]
MFELKVKASADSATIHFIGSLSIRDTPTLRSELSRLKDNGIKYIVFDFKELNFLDSSGIGVLLHTYNWAKEREGSVKIIHMSKEVKSIFTISNLLDLFSVET